MIQVPQDVRHGLIRTMTDGDIDSLVARLDLESKVRLLTGATPWRLPSEPRIGLRSVVLSDGPVGVRGTGEGPLTTSVLLPSPTCVAATWDPDLAAEIGALFATEARRHGADVVLAPLVNLQRTPVAGRHFESLSEDPLLTARIGTALIRGTQDQGVGVCVKHFVANESETARTQYVSAVDAQVLRQVYLPPFEQAVHEGAVSTVMAAYNGVDDGTECARMTEHHHLLVDVLKDEWGFDGPVVSDWAATQSTIASARGGLDVVMPGPVGPWGRALVEAVRANEVDEAVVDDKVHRLLVLADKVGALEGTLPVALPSPPDDSLPRHVAAAGTVVLKTDDLILPVGTSGTPRTISLIGPNAVHPFYQGGGSAHVTPTHAVSPAEGLARAFPEAEIILVGGVDSSLHAPLVDPGRLTDPDGHPGVRLTQMAKDGTVLARGTAGWTGVVTPVVEGAESIRIECTVNLSEPGLHELGLGHIGSHRLWLDGEEIEVTHRDVSDDVVLDSSIDHPPTRMHPVEGDRRVVLRGEFPVVHTHWGDVTLAFLRHRAPGPGDEEGIARAVAAASASDLTVLVVGTNEDVESEGWDRTSLELPGRQDDLVRAVLRADPEAVVVVNAGGPVLLPWLDRARTVLWSWLPGQAFGDALADVLSGRQEPSGRLPWTLPASASDVPIPDAVPDEDGRVVYSEGLDVGYRAYAHSSRCAAAPFGHGLGWTRWKYANPDVTRHGRDLEIRVVVTNVGGRRGRETVQVYAEHDGNSDIPLPTRWLIGFASVTADPGRQEDVTVHVPARAFQAWNPSTGWTTVSGTYRIDIGRSSEDTRLQVEVVV